MLSNVPKLNIGRTRATAVKHEGCLYVVGGMITSLDDISDTQDIASVERYNPRRNCWERCASLLQARCVSGVSVFKWLRGVRFSANLSTVEI